MTQSSRHLLRRGFTIIELIVSVGIVVLLIFAVGLVFRSTSRSVGISQSVMELLSNSAAIQQQMESDVSGMNKSGFLVIRSGTFVDNTIPAAPITRRCDQIAFLATGAFQHRTGSQSNATSSFTDISNESSGLVWWGQVALCQGIGAAAAPTNPRTYLNTDQTYHVPLTQVPTGVAESDFTLGRSVILLTPKSSATTVQAPSGTSIAAYQPVTSVTPNLAAIDYGVASVQANVGETTLADITQSRVDAAATFPIQAMDYLRQAVSGGRTAITARYEADHYCFRRAALRSPYDSELPAASTLPPAVNGYYRMHTLALQGVPTFAVEWTDGSVFAANDIDPTTGGTLAGTSPLIGTARWYGMNNAKCGNNAAGIVDPAGTVATTPNGDVYTAIFSFDNRPQWPVALRFRYHISDPSNRLPSGREVVQVVKLSV